MHGLRMGGNGMTQAEYNALCITADARAVEKSKKRGEVMEKKIVIPDGMLDAFEDAHVEYLLKHKSDPLVPMKACIFALEAALRWLSENPIVPTMEQATEMSDSGHPCVLDGVWYATEWQRRMFLALEPEAPESVKHLLLQGQWDPMPSRDVYNQRIIDAYNQGKKSSVPKKCTHPFAARFKVDDHVGCEYSEVCGTCMKVFK